MSLFRRKKGKTASELQQERITAEYQMVSVNRAIDNLKSNINSSWFSISDLTKLVDATGNEWAYGDEPMKRLHKLHCVEWRDIPDNVRVHMMQDIAELSGVWIEIPLKNPKKGKVTLKPGYRDWDM